MENSVVVTQKQGTISCDFESAKAYLQSRLDEFRGVLFTEDTKKDAKKVVAELRKEKKALSDRVKEVKKEYMVPFDEFFEKICVLLDMYDEPINFINAQIEDYEKKRIEEKKAFIRQLYDEFIGSDNEISAFLPLDKIYNPKWENATTNRKAICEELYTYKDNAKNAITTIKSMETDPEIEETALLMYKESFDLNRSVMFIAQREKQNALILERERERVRREEEERIRKEERAKFEAEQKSMEEKASILRQAEEDKQRAVEEAKQEAEKAVYESLIPDSSGTTAMYQYKMSLTQDEKEKLEMYMNSIGIDWELI